MEIIKTRKHRKKSWWTVVHVWWNNAACILLKVRIRISESQASEIAYYAAMKIIHVIDQSWLIVHNIEENLRYLSLWVFDQDSMHEFG